MKIRELVEFVSNKKNKMFKVDQLQELIKKELEVKDYISIKDKKQLVETIVDDCILYDHGVFKFDEIDKYVAFTMKTISAYTNLELSNDIESDYDVLCSAGILEMLIDTFKKEYDEVNILLQMKCDYILSDNNIEAQIGKFLDSILDKVDNLVKVISTKAKNLDVSKLPIDLNKTDLKKILDFVNSQK